MGFCFPFYPFPPHAQSKGPLQDVNPRWHIRAWCFGMGVRIVPSEVCNGASLAVAVLRWAPLSHVGLGIRGGSDKSEHCARLAG